MSILVVNIAGKALELYNSITDDKLDKLIKRKFGLITYNQYSYL